MNLKLLPPPEQDVAAKVLYNMGWSSRKIESWLGISDSSVIRASEQPTPDELKQFEADFTQTIKHEKMRGVALVVNKINELVPKATRVDHLPHVIKAGEFLEGKERTPNVAVQVNNNLSDIEFVTDNASKTTQESV